MKKLWDSIKSWLRENAGEIEKDLLPGASKKELDKAEKEMQVQIPLELKESLQIHNGQKGMAAPLMGDWQLISLEIMLKKWKMMKKLFGNKDEKTVDKDWWDMHWVPFAYNGAGDFLCVNLKQEKGKYGQVITFWHTHEKREVVADNYKKLMADFANELESGKFKYENEKMIKIQD